MDSTFDRRVIVYPCYINSKRTVAKGRKVPLPKACDDPRIDEIVDCCNHLKLPAQAEGKSHPRDFPPCGRVRVKLKQDDGSFCNPDITSRMALYARVAELVPRHPGRSKKAQSQAAAKQVAAQPSSSTSSAPSTGKVSSKGNKKKSRK